MRLHGQSQCFPLFIHGGTHKIIVHILTKPLYMTTFTGKKKGDSGERNQILLNFSSIFFTGHPAVFIKLKDNKLFSGFSQTQQYIYYTFILKTCCGHQTFTRPSLQQNLESGKCSASSIHVMWDPT
jgi:hypothetical protein